MCTMQCDYLYLHPLIQLLCPSPPSTVFFSLPPRPSLLLFSPFPHQLLLVLHICTWVHVNPLEHGKPTNVHILKKGLLSLSWQLSTARSSLQSSEERKMCHYTTTREKVTHNHSLGSWLPFYCCSL